MTLHSIVRSLVCLAALGLATPALCQDGDTRARELYEEGTRLYDLGRYEESVAAFQLAYGLSKRPQMLYNMASAMERLARWEEALDALQQYRRDAESSAEELVSLTVRIEQLQIRIKARDEQQAIDAPPPPPDPIAQAPAPRRGLPAGAWALYGGGVAGLGAGVLFSSRASSARNEWQSACVDGDVLLCSSDVQDAWKRDNGNSLAADLSFLVGVGSSIGGVFVTLKNSQSADLQVGFAPQLWAGGGAVSFRGQF